MPHKYFACEWLIDFDVLDLNYGLDFIDEHGLELRYSNVGNKFLRFVIAVDNEDQIYKFVSSIGQVISATEWQLVSQAEFESTTPIKHSQEHRNQTLATFDLIHKYTDETSKFYKQAYKSSDTNNLYRAQWFINKKGLDERVIEKAFDVVEHWNSARIVSKRQDLSSYFEIYIVMSTKLNLNELLLQLPQQIGNLAWVKIHPDELPDGVSGHPYNFDANIYAAWREGLYEWLSHL